MTRSNTANAGRSYFDLDMQTVSMDGGGVTVRAVVYLTSLNVNDTFNSLDVGGNWSRGGALGLGGSYSGTPVWFQDIWAGRAIGGEYNLNVSASFSGVEYWGVTLSASNYYTVPRQDIVPNPPPTGVDSVTSNSARVVVFPAADNGHGVDGYEAYVLTNNAWPGQGGNVISSAAGGTFTAGGLARATLYFYTARAHNAVGWSGWAAMGTFYTLATALDPLPAPTIGAITQDSGFISWPAPNNGGSGITNYTLQVSSSGGFTTGVQTLTVNGNSATVSGLDPATLYYARIRANNAVGSGAFSASSTFTTEAGFRVKVNGVWYQAKVWVKVAGVWRLAKPWKKVSGSWRM